MGAVAASAGAHHAVSTSLDGLGNHVVVDRVQRHVGADLDFQPVEGALEVRVAAVAADLIPPAIGGDSKCYGFPACVEGLPDEGFGCFFSPCSCLRAPRSSVSPVEP